MSRGLAPASVRRVHAIVRRALSQAVKWEVVERNVALNASQPQETQREQHPTSVEIVREVIEEATRQDTHGVGLLVRLCGRDRSQARRASRVALESRQSRCEVPTVASRLGHRDLTTTGRIHLHRTQRADQQVADVVDRLLRTDPS